MKQNLRKGSNVQYNGKRLSQCINSSDSSFSSFLSAPKKKEVRWEASSLEVGSARYSKTTNHHASFLIHFHSSFKKFRLRVCTRPFLLYRTRCCSVTTRKSHVSSLILMHSYAGTMHVCYKTHKKINPLHLSS